MVEDGLKKAKEKSRNYKKKINRTKHTSLHQKWEEKTVLPLFPQMNKRFLSTLLNMLSRLNII